MLKDNKTKKKFVIYTRCSTDDQAQGEYTTLDAQIHHCKNMLDAFGYELSTIGDNGIIKDDGYSGKDLNRPGIQKILEEINKNRNFDGIIFLKLDRLTRNPRDLYSLIDLFKDKDIDFISVRENLDSSTPIGRVVIGILGLLSAFEREQIGERVKASCIARVRQGRWVGGKVPMGYKLTPNGEPLPNGKQPHKIILDEEKAHQLKLIWEMAADNRSLRAIAEELTKRGIKTSTGKEWRTQTVSNIVKNPFYKGYIRYSGEIHKGNHEALIDELLWAKANKILTAKLPGHKFSAKPKEYTFLFSGILICEECGSHLISCNANGRNDKFYYYECTRARQKLGCRQQRINAKAFDKAIIDYFKEASNDRDLIVKAIGNAIIESQVKLEELENKITVKNKKLSELKFEAQKLLDLAMNDVIPQGNTIKVKMTEIEAKITQIEDELSKLQAQKQAAQMNAHSGKFLQRNIKFAMEHLDEVPAETQQSLIRSLVKDVSVGKDKLAINMFIANPIEQAIPSEILAQDASGSPVHQQWGG